MAKEAKVLQRVMIAGTAREVRFGKNDRIAALAIGPAEDPTGHAFVTRDGAVAQFDLAAYPEEIVRKLAWHGMKQKLKDAHAALEDDSECLAASQRVHEQLASGVWAGAGGGGGGGGDLDLIEVLAEVTGGSHDTIREKVRAMKPEERKALRVHAPVKEVLDRRAAERVKSIDAEGLLAQF